VQQGGSVPAAAGDNNQADEQQHQQYQKQQLGQHQQDVEQGAAVGVQEVVRVTATNWDMSRPLRSADLLAVYHASIVPSPGQLFEFQPDPGLQTIAFERVGRLKCIDCLWVALRPLWQWLPVGGGCLWPWLWLACCLLACKE
jgi:hypothetical protein